MVDMSTKIRAFVVDEFIQNGGSTISTQRAFRTHSALARHDSVPDKKEFTFEC